MSEERKTGTKEWAEVNRNFMLGCKHGCRYCYAREMAERFKRIADEESWKTMSINDASFNEKPRKFDGRVMFPTAHDIVPEYLPQTLVYLRKWLFVGNNILITSKPHFDCIKAICDDLGEFKDQIVFRFTIGSMDDNILKFWEPGAPSYDERLQSLRYAYTKGFKTSVSCEPYLDGKIANLVTALLPFINDTIWVGKMNQIKKRVKTDKWKPEEIKFLNIVKASQTDDKIKQLYETFKTNSKVKWKDSIKEVLGLPEEEIG